MVRAKARLTRESGAMVIEYALLLTVISMAIAIQLLGLRPPICQLISNVGQLLGSQPSGSACVGDGVPIATGGNNGDGGTPGNSGNSGTPGNSGNSGNNGNNGNGNGTGNGKGNNGIGGGTGGGASNGNGGGNGRGNGGGRGP